MAKKIRKRLANFYDGENLNPGGNGQQMDVQGGNGQETQGNSSKGGGPSGASIAGAVMGGVSAITNGIANMVNAPKQVAAQKAAEINDYRNQTNNFGAVTTKDLLNQSNFGMANPGTFRDFMGSKGENAMGVINMGLQGASAGASTGGLGAAIGAGVGILGGLFGNAAKKRKAKKLYRNAVKDAGRANDQAINNYNAAVENLDTQQDLNALANYSAYGGPINMRYTGNMSPFGNRYAFGGDLIANGADWSNGYITIDNGGTHEENPYEGVQMGVDIQGIPNLVEEGEFIYNDYVFSNRLKVPKNIRNKYKLRGNKDVSFADAAKEIAKESKERPNDPISNRGLKAMLGELQGVQEDERFKKEMRNPEKRKQIMMQLAAQQNQQAQAQQQIQPQQENIEGMQYAYGGKLGNIFAGDGDKPNSLKYPYSVSDYFSNIPGTNIPNIYSNIPKTPDWNPLEGTSADPKYNRSYDVEVPLNPNSPIIDNTEVDTTHVGGKRSKEPTWLRYAPVAGAALGLVENLLSKPNYSYADSVLRAANDVGNYDTVSAKPIGDYLTYRPFDRNYYINKLNGQAAAANRAIINQSAGNRGTAIAGLLASGYNAQGQLGNLARQAEEYNLNQREKVAAFNRGTNQFNSEMGLKAAMANQEARSRAKSARYTGVLQAMNMKDTVDARRAASKSANLTNLFNSLGDIGKEATARNMVNTNPGIYYSINKDGKVEYINDYDNLSEYHKSRVRQAAEKEIAKRGRK